MSHLFPGTEEEEVEAYKRDQLAQHIAHAKLIHDVFVKNESGQKLLANWVQYILKGPVLDENSTQFSVGIAEGQRNLVRHIVQMIQLAEQGE